MLKKGILLIALLLFFCRLSLNAQNTNILAAKIRIYDAYGQRISSSGFSGSYVMYCFLSLKKKHDRKVLIKLEMLSRKYYPAGLNIVPVNISGRVGQAYLQKLDEAGYTLSLYWANFQNVKSVTGYAGSPILYLTNSRGSLLFYKGCFTNLKEKKIKDVLKGKGKSLSKVLYISARSAGPSGIDSRPALRQRMGNGGALTSAIRGGLLRETQVLPGTHEGTSTFRLSPPVDAAIIQSGFGYRRNPFNGRISFHPGIDFWKHAINRTPIKAAAAGVVTKAVKRGSYYGYGLFIVIKHNSVYSTAYAHCSAVYVKKGQRVRQGQVIGRVGRTGSATGAHLHFELRVKGKQVNPIGFIR